MGNQSPACVKKMHRSKTPTPMTQKEVSKSGNAKPILMKQKSQIQQSRVIKSPPIPKALIKTEGKPDDDLDEIQTSLDFFNDYLQIRDMAEINCDVLTNNCLITYNLEERPSGRNNIISFDEILGEKKSQRNRTSNRIAHEIHLEQESLKSIDYLSRIQEGGDLERAAPRIEDPGKKRNSKGKPKTIRTSLKSIKENSSSLFSNKFETDNEIESEKEARQEKNSSKKNRKEEVSTAAKRSNNNENTEESAEKSNNQIKPAQKLNESNQLERKQEINAQAVKIQTENPKTTEKPIISDHYDNSLVREFDLEEQNLKGYLSKGDNKNTLMNLAYSKITCVDADQTQSAFGRMSFGSEQFNQYFVEEKSPPKVESSKEKDEEVRNPFQGKERRELLESETDSRKNGESAQGSNLRSQIMKILGDVDQRNRDSKENSKGSMGVPERKAKENIRVIQQIPEMSRNEEEGPSISLSNSNIRNAPQTSKVKKTPEVSANSIKQYSINPIYNVQTPKQKQKTVQSHYLNKSQNTTYSSIMKQKKQENAQSYNKMLNASKIDLKIERSVLGNNSIIISPMNRCPPMNAQKINVEFKKANDLNPVKKSISIARRKPQIEEKSNENDAFQINLNLNLGKNFREKPQELTSKQQTYQNQENSTYNFGEEYEGKKEREAAQNIYQEEGSCADSGDEILISTVKVDIENLKNKMMASPDHYVKSSTYEKFQEGTTDAGSLRDRINKVLSKKTLTTETEEIPFEKVIDMLPTYDPVSYEEGDSDNDEEDEESS